MAAVLGASAHALDLYKQPLRAFVKAGNRQDLADRLSVEISDITKIEFDSLPDMDILVAADVLYQEDLSLALAQLVGEARNRGISVLFADSGKQDRETFEKRLLELQPNEPPVFKVFEGLPSYESRNPMVNVLCLPDNLLGGN
eukprot:gnl/TRDRNA2_/TRDRNA2_47704_c1_seq1.p1 gnl/TRDRNA2_/TRDRNA2_47704_c1~~gnl/TRDRNA2_/TRDRNA2_47704_c1_seq1.p1  ORF type:complete len:159 (-),score=10.79 gnl/TRDRNA2_/TRDRNA2_47704_c1_seq1:91-519(-)